MRKVSVRVWGVGVWCVLGAACLARETESVGTAGAAGSGATGSAPLCGVENTERVSDIVCAVTADWCERLAGCCQASGFGGAAGDCRAQQVPLCVETVRADLAAGACFDVAAYDPACEELTLESISRCSTAGLLSVDLLQRSEALGCSTFWIHGHVPDRASCTPGGSAQCAQAEGERSSAFLTFPVTPRRTSATSCAAVRRGKAVASAIAASTVPAATRAVSVRCRGIPARPARMVSLIAAAGCARMVLVSTSAGPAVKVSFPAARAETVARTDGATNVRSRTRAAAILA